MSRTLLDPEKTSHECWQANKRQHHKVQIPKISAKERQNELNSTVSTTFEKKTSMRKGGRGGG